MIKRDVMIYWTSVTYVNERYKKDTKQKHNYQGLTRINTLVTKPSSDNMANHSTARRHMCRTFDSVRLLIG